jgi:sugar/nucleoside kinase (ribokinase family)
MTDPVWDGEPTQGRAVPDVVVVGSASRDVAADDRRGWRMGGGAAYGALTLARFGLRAGVVVGVDREASRAPELDLLRQAGVEIHLVPLEHAPVFQNVETPQGRVQTCLEPGDPLPGEALPVHWLEAGAWLMAPVAGEVSDSWAALPRGGAIVALGWQGLLRNLSRGDLVRPRPPGRSALLSRADIVSVSHRDLDPETPIEALTTLLKPGAALLVTQGAMGGLIVEAADGGRVVRRRYPAIPGRATDPTGAGDVFLAALLAARLAPALRGSGRRGGDLHVAAAAASLVVERPGLTGVPDLPAVVGRLRGSLRGPEPPGDAVDGGVGARERGVSSGE